jgi:DNA-binding transcriptional regulator YdaS (Cro superfamily)
MNTANPIETAIGLFGSEEKLAAAIGVSQPAVNKAKHRVAAGGKVSGELAAKIDVATSGKISRHVLRPDLWPVEVAA